MEIEHRTKFLGTLAFLKYLRKEKCEKQKEKSNFEENIGNLVALKQQKKEKPERKNEKIQGWPYILSHTKPSMILLVHMRASQQ